MKTPGWWQRKCLMSEILRPLAGVWEVGSLLRQKIAAPEKMPVPVICIGNVVAGGGGKTPVALALGEDAKKRGINAFFLSRGYGGSITTPTRVNLEKHTAREVGDEPLLLAQTLPTIIARNRVQGARLAVAEGAKLIIMDDGLQNPSLHKDISILVMKGAKPIGNGLIIPAGPLREPLKAAMKRVDAVLHIDGEGAILPDEVTQSGKPVFAVGSRIEIRDSGIEPVGERAINPRSGASCESQQAFTEAHKKVVAFTGIAYPEHFRASLERAGLQVVTFHAFADHHPYTADELKALAESAADLNTPLITTEKDWVRLAPLLKDYPQSIHIARLQYRLPEALFSLVFAASA